MITSDSIDVYSKYNGDTFGLDHSGSKADKEAANLGAWSLLERFEQRLMIVNRGLASAGFAAQLYQEIEENCDSQETIDKLKKWAGQRLERSEPDPQPGLITLALVDIYSKYLGDYAEYYYRASKREKEAASHDAWQTLARLMRQQSQVNMGRASAEFAAELQRQIQQSCDSQETVNRLHEIVNK